MKKIIEALQNTHNIETYKHKINHKVNVHITKIDMHGNNFLLEYESNDQLIHAVTATAEEASML